MSSVKSVETRSSTMSDLIDAESEVQAMLDSLNQRMAAIQLKKSRRTPVPIPFDDKEWVQEAKKWREVTERTPGALFWTLALGLTGREDNTCCAHGQRRKRVHRLSE